MTRRVKWGVAGGVVMWIGVVIGVVILRTLLKVLHIPQDGMFPTYPAATKVLTVRYLGAPSVDRGDIVVFREERPDGSYDFIWRVIGLPGETVEVRDDVVHIDGAPLAQSPEPSSGDLRILRESTGSSSHLIALPATKPSASAANHGPVVVPPASLFLMGDNRHNAHDSRAVGCIPMSTVWSRAVATLVEGDRR
jgi:signal peptidase I